MEKCHFYLIASVISGVLFCPVEGVSSYSGQGKDGKQVARDNHHEQLENEKYDIMHRNQIDDTDVLAIPLDDSEVEDEEEINQLEKKEVFDLPKSPNHR